VSMTAHTSETSRKTTLSILPFWLLDLRVVCLPESRVRTLRMICFLLEALVLARYERFCPTEMERRTVRK